MERKRNKRSWQKRQSDTPNAPAAKEEASAEAGSVEPPSGTKPQETTAPKPPEKPQPPPGPTTSKTAKRHKSPKHHKPFQPMAPEEPPEESCWKKFRIYLYNREKRTFCERTCQSWLHITIYSIMYFIFLTTYMLIFLYCSLVIVKSDLKSASLDKTHLLTYSEYGIGLSATPTSEGSDPLIWYRNGQEDDYGKYIKSIDKLLLRRKTRDVEASLGQCGRSPYGYGDAPCVIVRINKQLRWTGKAFGRNSTLGADVPKEVVEWVKSGKRMLWLHCGGYHSYDKEHMGSVRYYPNPPGFNPALFPLDVKDDPPLVAVQFSSFTEGVSLAIQCKLYHEHGPSSVEFVLYVEPRDKTHLYGSNT